MKDEKTKLRELSEFLALGITRGHMKVIQGEWEAFSASTFIEETLKTWLKYENNH